MEARHIAIRVDQATSDQLEARASIERRSIDSIVVDAIHEYLHAHPVSREQMLALVRDIVKEDATLLKALAEA